MQFVECGGLRIGRRNRGVRHDRSVLYVLVSAFTLEAYRFAPVFHLLPSSSVAVRVLPMYCPELFCLGVRYRRIVFCFCDEPCCVACET